MSTETYPTQQLHPLDLRDSADDLVNNREEGVALFRQMNIEVVKAFESDNQPLAELFDGRAEKVARTIMKFNAKR